MQVSRGGGPGKNRQVTVYGASTAVSWPGRLRQTRSFFPQPLTRSDAGHRRALDQPLAASRLRTELLECRLAGCHREVHAVQQDLRIMRTTAAYIVCS